MVGFGWKVLGPCHGWGLLPSPGIVPQDEVQGCLGDACCSLGLLGQDGKAEG